MMPTRMSLKKNLMAACSIGVLAAVVTGCGSSDKGSVSPALAAAQSQVSASDRVPRRLHERSPRRLQRRTVAAAEAERDAALAAVTAAEGALN